MRPGRIWDSARPSNCASNGRSWRLRKPWGCSFRHFRVHRHHVGASNVQVEGSHARGLILRMHETFGITLVARTQALLLPRLIVVAVIDPVSPIQPERLFHDWLYSRSELKRSSAKLVAVAGGVSGEYEFRQTTFKLSSGKEP